MFFIKMNSSCEDKPCEVTAFILLNSALSLCVHDGGDDAPDDLFIINVI